MIDMQYASSAFERLTEDVRQQLEALANQRSNLSNDELQNVAEATSSLFEILDSSMSLSTLDNAQGRGDGPCGQLVQKAAALYGAYDARLGLNGSSGTNVTIAMALAHHFGRPVSVLIDQAVHLSVLGGHAMAGSTVHWLPRSFHPELGVQEPQTPQDLAAAMDALPTLDAVVMTMPSYDGFVFENLHLFRKVCNERDALLIVDGAWGFLHRLLTKCGFPESAAHIADVTTISPHKKGAGLSQNSLALFGTPTLIASFDAVSDLGLASTSPAYYALMPLEASLNFWGSTEAKNLGQRMVTEAQAFSNAMEAIPGINRIQATGLGEGFVGDPCHLVFNTLQTGVTGYDILEYLAEHDGIDVEKATLDTLMFLFGPEQIETWPQTADAVVKAVATLPKHNLAQLPPPPAAPINQVMSPHDAMFRRDKIVVPIRNAIGKTSAQMVAAYPPGSAVIAPGGIVTAEAIEYLLAVEAAGSRLKGVDGPLDVCGLLTVAPFAQPAIPPEKHKPVWSPHTHLVPQ